MDSKLFSETLCNFLKALDEAKNDYAFALKAEEYNEKLSQDYLHMLELQDLKYHERARIANRLRDCRSARREAKDTICMNEPVVEFLESERGKMAVNLMKQLLGDVRKAEKSLKGRTYTPRVLSEEEYLRIVQGRCACDLQ